MKGLIAMNKFEVERQCLITGDYIKSEINWKSLVSFLSMKTTLYNETKTENGKHYTMHTHIFTAMDKNYNYKIFYESACLH